MTRLHFQAFVSRAAKRGSGDSRYLTKLVAQMPSKPKSVKASQSCSSANRTSKVPPKAFLLSCGLIRDCVKLCSHTKQDFHVPCNVTCDVT